MNFFKNRNFETSYLPPVHDNNRLFSVYYFMIEIWFSSGQRGNVILMKDRYNSSRWEQPVAAIWTKMSQNRDGKINFMVIQQGQVF